MKKEYKAAELEILKFEAEDIVTTSPGDGWSDDEMENDGHG